MESISCSNSFLRVLPIFYPDKQFANSSPESHQFEKGKRKVFEILEHLRYYISDLPHVVPIGVGLTKSKTATFFPIRAAAYKNKHISYK